MVQTYNEFDCRYVKDDKGKMKLEKGELTARGTVRISEFTATNMNENSNVLFYELAGPTPEEIAAKKAAMDLKKKEAAEKKATLAAETKVKKEATKK